MKDGIMKDWILRIAKLLLLVLLAAGGLLVVKGTARQVDFGKLQADVEKAMDLSDMKQGDTRMLRRFYDLNAPASNPSFPKEPSYY